MPAPDAPPLTLGELERQHILAVLERCHNNRTQAARLLDISIRTLRNKLHEYNHAPPPPAGAP
ncbi:MAG: helix-turn-helix domain-containing protein [Verrucomicrobia bacterium]|nr:helix-turn-helix domain-containing protein [Verrucomicrobiota bacterium]